MTKGSGPQSDRARQRAVARFFEALERATTRDDAWRVVLSGPKVPLPAAEHYERLSRFLKSLEAPAAASRAEREAYLALIRRFLRTGAIEESEARRVINALAGRP
ncbi:MAG: hypothetical protein U0235_18520 [Polyangiaceae bacterium]